MSFSYKLGLPKGMDLVFDTRFLRNPYWDPPLRALNGTDPEVQDYVKEDPLFESFTSKVTDLLLLLLPAFENEGKSHIAVGFGCTGGQHRSVTTTEIVAQRLEAAGWQVSKRHREHHRWALK